MNNNQRAFSRALNPFLRALKNTNIRINNNNNNNEIRLNTFLNAAFREGEYVMNEKNLVRIGRLGGKAYPIQRQNALNSRNTLGNLPAKLIIGFANDMGSKISDQETKVKVYEHVFSSDWLHFNNKETKNILNALSSGLNRTKLVELKGFLQNMGIGNNNNLMRSLNSKIGAQNRVQNAARGMVGRLRNRQVGALEKSVLPPNVLELIRKKM